MGKKSPKKNGDFMANENQMCESKRERDRQGYVLMVLVLRGALAAFGLTIFLTVSLRIWQRFSFFFFSVLVAFQAVLFFLVT